MYEYTTFQWLIFFYIYCFLGWCFESAYVSIATRKLVNRGFINGPLLPLYGTGAVLVLYTALPFRQIPVLVYLVGALSATILEYCVGVVMEELFKVRYWDYSDKKFNIQGHICLSSSIAWGFLSLALVYGMHKPFENYVLSLPLTVVNVVAIVVTIVAGIDFLQSLKTALDIRDLIIQMENMRTEIGYMKRRVEIIDTFARAEMDERRAEFDERVGERKAEFGERLDESRTEFGERLDESRALFNERLNESKAEFGERLDESKAAFDEGKAVLDERKAVLEERLEQMTSRLRSQISKDKIRMLRRNPSAKYTKLPEFTENLRRDALKSLKEKIRFEDLEQFKWGGTDKKNEKR